MDTIPEIDAADFADVNTNIEHGNMHNNTSPHETLYEDSIRNTMLTEYNWIVIGSFKEFFQSVDTQPVRGSAGVKGTKFHASQQSTRASMLLQHATGTMPNNCWRRSWPC